MSGDEKDETVLGNLPRARPGRRSEKRAQGSSTGGTAARAGAGRPSKAARASAGGRAKAAAGKRPAARKAPSSRSAGAARARPSAPRPEAAGPAQRRGSDPVGDALRLAGNLAEAGLKTAEGIIRRLPGAR